MTTSPQEKYNKWKTRGNVWGSTVRVTHDEDDRWEGGGGEEGGGAAYYPWQNKSLFVLCKILP